SCDTDPARTEQRIWPGYGRAKVILTWIAAGRAERLATPTVHTPGSSPPRAPNANRHRTDRLTGRQLSKPAVMSTINRRPCRVCSQIRRSTAGDMVTTTVSASCAGSGATIREVAVACHSQWRNGTWVTLGLKC